MGDRYTCLVSPRHVWRPGGVASSTPTRRYGCCYRWVLVNRVLHVRCCVCARTTLLRVPTDARRGVLCKNFGARGRGCVVLAVLGLLARCGASAAAAVPAAQLALPRCHRASRARLAGGALAGGSLRPPPARDDVRALGGPLAGAAPAAGAPGAERSAISGARRLVRLAAPERSREERQTRRRP